MVYVELNLALQIFGILLYTIGTMMAIVELWKSFSNFNSIFRS
jgi:hypothetical protein